MHELSITRSIVAIVSEHAHGRRVTRVRLEIGRLSAIMPDAIRFCFELCAEGTPVAGAQLQIDEIDGLGCCEDCGASVALQTPVGCCARCGGSRLNLIAGDEMQIKEMEVEPCV